MQAWQQEQIRALKESGSAGVLGGLTAVAQQMNAQNQQLAATGNELQYQRDLARAQNAQQIEQGRMQREYAMNQAKLAGAQTAAAEGRQAQNVAVQGGLSALSNAAMLKTYKDIYGNPNPLNQGAGTSQQVQNVNYPSLSATGTPVQNQYAPQINSVAGLTNQFAAMQTPMPQPQQLFENALTQGTPSYPYPLNWMIQNQNLPR